VHISVSVPECGNGRIESRPEPEFLYVVVVIVAYNAIILHSRNPPSVLASRSSLSGIAKRFSFCQKLSGPTIASSNGTNGRSGGVLFQEVKWSGCVITQLHLVQKLVPKDLVALPSMSLQQVHGKCMVPPAVSVPSESDRCSTTIHFFPFLLQIRQNCRTNIRDAKSIGKSQAFWLLFKYRCGMASVEDAERSGRPSTIKAYRSVTHPVSWTQDVVSTT